MNRNTIWEIAASLFAVFVFSSGVSAQGVCDSGNGPLNPAQPAGINPEEIIQKFMAKEATFKSARDRYGYTVNVTVQTLDNFGEVDGEYKQTSEVVLEQDGKRTERTTFAPESTLRKISLSQDDMDDIHEHVPFPLTAEELPHLSITYTGRQHVDQLDTYVFTISPKKEVKKGNAVFEGRVWVDDQDMVIVKTCGKPRPDENVNSKKKNALVSVTPVFVSYREQFDGKMWFPTYSKAEEFLNMGKESVHIREIVKYSNYKLLSSK